MINPKKLKPFPFIEQVNLMECGTTCLAMIFKYYGFYNIRNLLSEVAQVNTEGTDLYTLSEIANSMGFEADGYQLSFAHMEEVHLPCIAHFDGNHFVVVYKFNKKYVWIADPAYGKDKITKEEFESRWNGIILNLVPQADLFQNKDMLDLVDERRKRSKNVFNNFYTSILSPFKRVILEILGASLLLQLAGLALPLFTQSLIDHVLVDKNQQLLYAILFGFICVFCTQVILTYVRNVLMNQFKVQLELGFFSRFFEHLIFLNQKFFDAFKREDFINRFHENMKLRQVLNPTILQTIIDFVFILMYLGILFVFNGFLAWTAVFFTLVYFVSMAIYTPRLKHLENKVFHENVKTMGSFLDSLLGIQNVKLLGIEKLAFWKWKNQYTKNLNKVLTTEQVYLNLSTLLQAIHFIGQVSVYWIGAYLAFNQEMSIGQYIAFITIYTMVITAVSNTSKLWFMLAELSVSYDRLNDILVQRSGKKELNEYVPVKFSEPSIHIHNLSFSYQEGKSKPALDGITLDIKPGEFLGIVGRNGSGKTTICKLLTRLYEDYQGEININGCEIRKVVPSLYKKKVVMVPQEIYLFDATIKENIQFGNPEATDQEIVEAAKMALLHDFVKSNYLGYNLKIGENGVNLSGGEKRKIAIARLFVANPEIIILDEASSALDLESERKIMDNIFQKFQRKTIISVAHRLNTLKKADRIAVFDKGSIVEEGSHDQLLASRGVYHKFINSYVGS
ncbi:MAG: peptidase domain-containing ABC transporter [Ekhidna sp.]